MADNPTPTDQRRFTTKRFPGYGWKVLDGGVPIGNKLGPWWPSRKHALADAERRTTEFRS